jgi:RHS repeat-associated protein
MGVTNWEADAIDGGVTLTNADGSVLVENFVSDPRFPSQTHLLSRATLNLPGGLSWQGIASYAITTNSQTSLARGGWTNLFSVNGNTYTDTYNGSNQLEVTASPEGRQDTLQVDTQGRPLAEWQPGLATTTVSYDGAGRLGSISDQSAEGIRTSTLAYDALGRLRLLTDPLGRTNAFAYDAANQLQQLTLADGRVANFQHDAEFNITAITPPGRPAHTFNYNAVGLLTNYTPPFVTEDDSIGYAYDTQSQLARAKFPDGQTILLNWNADGNLTNIVLGSGPTLSAAYSTSSGQLAKLTSSTGDAMGFTQQGPLLSGVQWSGSVTGSVSIQFNNDLVPAIQTVGGASAVAFSYDGDLLLTNAGPLGLTRDTNGFVTATSAGMVQDARAYDDLGRMTQYSVTVGGSNFWSVALAYDLLDRITNKVESTSGSISRTWQFAYDSEGRLSQVWLNGIVAATYNYDTNGNRLTRNSDTATYDAQDRVQTYAGDNFTWSPNGMLNHHVSAGQTTTYAWDLRSALASVALPDGRTVAYVLDGLGRRIGKQINGVLQRGWLYDDQDRPVAELNGSSVVTEQFVYCDGSSTPSLCMAGTNLYVLISDERGSIRFVLNTADGTLAQALDYDEFGRVITDTNPGFQPFGFGGGLYDPDTTLVRFGAREYLAETGQWAARDPIAFNGGSFNLYCYVDNDPVNLLDPLGTGPYHRPYEYYQNRFSPHQKRLLNEAAIKIARNRGKASTWRQIHKNDIEPLEDYEELIKETAISVGREGVLHVIGAGLVGEANSAVEIINSGGQILGIGVNEATGGSLDAAQRAAKDAGNMQGPNSKKDPFIPSFNPFARH